MDDGLEQSLVAEHHSRTTSVADTLVFAQPGADIAGLDVLGRCGDKGYLFLTVETVVNLCVVGVEFIGEVG